MTEVTLKDSKKSYHPQVIAGFLKRRVQFQLAEWFKRLFPKDKDIQMIWWWCTLPGALPVHQSTPSATSSTLGVRQWVMAHRQLVPAKLIHWRHHGRPRLVGASLSPQLWFGITRFIEPWFYWGLLNNYRVKSPLLVLAGSGRADGVEGCWRLSLRLLAVIDSWCSK